MPHVPYRGRLDDLGSSRLRWHAPLVATPMEADCVMSVIIPARDERELIGAALLALSTQRDLDGRPLNPVQYEVIVLANNCDDDTAGVARAAQRRHPGMRLHVAEARFPSPEAHVGVARQVLMDEAVGRFRQLGRPRGVIASTDADTRVDPYWIARTLAAVQAGADAVGGRIFVERSDSETDPRAHSYHLRDVGYRMLATELTAHLDPDEADPWPRHFQHFGPSLAVTAAAYERAGGLPSHASLEDVALYRALRRIDARIRHDPAVRVETSSRCSYRTPFGFARQMRDWSRMGAAGIPQLVRSPAAIEAHALAMRDLRQLWRHTRLGALPAPDHVDGIASGLAVDTGCLASLVAAASTFGCLVEQVAVLRRVDGHRAPRRPDIDVRDAIAGLRERLAVLRSASAALEQVEPVELLALSE